MSDVYRGPWPIRPVTGAKVAVGDVVGRHDFIAGLFDDLRAGNDILMVDPRRMGKTSVLRRLIHEPPEPFDAILVDLEGAESVGECFNRLVRALRDDTTTWERVQTAVLRHVESVETDGPIKVKVTLGDRSPTELFTDLVLAVDSRLQAEDRVLVLAIDELPVAVDNVRKGEGPERAATFVQQLRFLRESTTAIRWILAGSIGFHHVLRDVGVTDGVLAGLAARSPGPLPQPEAELLAHCLLLGLGEEPSKKAISAVATESGGIPFIMHHIVHRLETDPTRPISPDQVAVAFEGFARDRDSSRALTHLLQRLDNATARRLLDRLAVEGPNTVSELLDWMQTTDEGFTRDDLVELLDSLEDDHYITTTEHSVQWRYEVLRRVWVIRRRLTR